jgi:hypothetical protein
MALTQIKSSNITDGIDEWKKVIKVTKDKYPKA